MICFHRKDKGASASRTTAAFSGVFVDENAANLRACQCSLRNGSNDSDGVEQLSEDDVGDGGKHDVDVPRDDVVGLVCRCRAGKIS